jgi:hypothetical protein
VVSEDITMQVRSRKETRQLIITTHNVNVAVAGDSDTFQVLKATADRAEVAHRGALDREPIQVEVIQHLEGGLVRWD